MASVALLAMKNGEDCTRVISEVLRDSCKQAAFRFPLLRGPCQIDEQGRTAEI